MAAVATARVRVASIPGRVELGTMVDGNVEASGDLADEIVGMHPRPLRFARSLTHDSYVAADLAKETVARALAAQWRFQPSTTQPVSRSRAHLAGRDSPAHRASKRNSKQRSVFGFLSGVP